MYVYVCGSRSRLKSSSQHFAGHYAPRRSSLWRSRKEATPTCGTMTRGTWARSYQCCRGAECSNWIWEDKVAEGYVCRKCGLAWRQPAQGFRDRSKSQPRGRYAPRQKPITPPPGLGGGRVSKLSQVHKATTDLLMGSWGSLDPKLQQQLEQLGIKPAPPTVEADDLTSVLKENMAQLPTAVKDLVEKITKPPPETEKDMAMKLKAQVSHLRDLSHKKQVLQQKLDNAKKTYGDMLEEMKTIQGKLEAEQGALHTTSAAYMALVNTSKPATELHEGESMEDTVPNAVAGFITTLGVSLTEDQKAQLTTMLKRPPAPITEDENKRRKMLEEVQQCG